MKKLTIRYQVANITTDGENKKVLLQPKVLEDGAPYYGNIEVGVFNAIQTDVDEFFAMHAEMDVTFTPAKA